MSRTNNIRRNTLIFFAWGPLVGGLGMILLFVASFDYPQTTLGYPVGTGSSPEPAYWPERSVVAIAGL